MQMACHVNGNSPEIPTGSGFYNIDRTASLLATASGWTFVGTITIPALAVTGSLDLAVTATAADQVLNADLSMNHATATGVAVDATAVQLTTARTSGNMIAFRGATTSLAGDTGSVKYTDFYAETPTDGGGTVFHVAFGVGSGHDRLIDCSAASTGQNDIVVPSNVADALNIGNGTLTYWTLVTSTATPRIDEAFVMTATGSAHTISGSINSASANFYSADVQGIQLTTARTSGAVAAYRGRTTSLAGDTSSVLYYDYLADTPTDGGGTVLHVAFGANAGHDRLIDCSLATTGQNAVVVPSNVADALNFGNGTLTYWTLATTTASPGITETWAHTGTAAGHTVNETINHATQVGVAVDATAVQLTTARTAGYAAGYRAKTTSLAGDLNGVPYAGLYVLAPTDGGGAVLHSGLYVEAGNDYSVHGLDNVRTAWGTGAAGVADATMGWDATILSLLAAVDDSVFKIGNGTNSFDVWTYGNTASDYLEWDASASTLYTRGAAAIGGLRTTGTTAVAITAVTVLTLADSGGIFTVNQGAAYDIDLPSPTTGAGCRYLFQLVGPASNAVTITVAGAAATFEGVIVNDVTSVLPATGATLTFVSGVAALGDCIEIVSTSTSKYFVRAICSTNGGITIT